MRTREVTRHELEKELDLTQDQVIELLDRLRDTELDGMTIDNFNNWKDGTGISFVTTHQGDGYEVEYTLTYPDIQTNVETEEALGAIKDYLKNESQMIEEIILVK